MASQKDTIDRAIELAAAGSSDQALELLRPVIRDEAKRDQALFALAYCFEKADNPSTAVHLYDWIVKRHPEFNVAANRLSECRDEAERRGLSEDFQDAGHVSCPCGLFRQRAEYGACPYCGRLREGVTAGSEAAAVPTDSQIPHVDSEGEDAATPQDKGPNDEVGAAVEKLRDLKEEAVSRLRELSETEHVKRVTTRAGELAREASNRLKAFTESEAAQDAAEKTREMGRDTSSAVKRFAEKPVVQNAKTKITRWGQERASDIREWVKSDRVQGAAKKAVKTFEGILARIQAVIDRMKK